jgi:hypothetical protein
VQAADPCATPGYTYYPLKTSRGGDIYTESSYSAFVLGTDTVRDDVTPAEMAAACSNDRPGCIAFDSLFNFKSTVAPEVGKQMGLPAAAGSDHGDAMRAGWHTTVRRRLSGSSWPRRSCW